MTPDAFAHHPELRGLITDPDISPLRGFDPQALAASWPEIGMARFLTPVADREASRSAALAGHAGMQAATDLGAGCDGLVFRIAAADVAEETEILWRREIAGRACRAVFVTAQTAAGPVRALAFTAGHASPAICADIPRAEQLRHIATGAGFFGSSLDYLTSSAAHFAALGIEDAEGASLMRETAAQRAARARHGNLQTETEERHDQHPQRPY